MRIATWNVNSVRARAERVQAWLEAAQPDVVAVQETKCSDANFPFELFAACGYDVVHAGVGGFNGVAVASRVGISQVQAGFAGAARELLERRCRDEGWDAGWLGEGRVVTATCGSVEVTSVYVPNGRELLLPEHHPHYRYKLAWLDALAVHAGDGAAAGRLAVIGGDFNVAPTDDCVWSTKHWRSPARERFEDPAFVYQGATHTSPPERDRIAAFAAAGWVDLYRAAGHDTGGFTWFNYRGAGFEKNQGLRIDLLLGSADLHARMTGAHVDLAERAAPKPSDHAPLVADVAVDAAVVSPPPSTLFDVA